MCLYGSSNVCVCMRERGEGETMLICNCKILDATINKHANSLQTLRDIY